MFVGVDDIMYTFLKAVKEKDSLITSDFRYSGFMDLAEAFMGFRLIAYFYVSV